MPQPLTSVLHPRHLQEWLASGVSEAITLANVSSLDDPHEIDKFLNQSASKGNRKSRKPLWSGGPGWVVCGIDPSTGMPRASQFKPDTPYIPHPEAISQKPRKYLGPTGNEVYPLFLDVPVKPNYWQALGANPSITVWTEGAKKAGSLITYGVPAISLAGVDCWGRGSKINPDLLPYCGVGDVVICAFDADQLTKPNVSRALEKLGRYVAAAGAVVKILDWYGENPDAPKGIDDYLMSFSEDDRMDRAHELVANAVPFEAWRKGHFERIKAKKEATKKEALGLNFIGTFDLETGRPSLPAGTKKTFVQQAFDAIFGKSGPWIYTNGNFYQWNGTHYEITADEVITGKIVRFLQEFVIYERDKETKEEYPITKFATPYHVAQITDWARKRCALPLEMVNPPGGLNLQNGFLQITWQGKKPRWELLPHDPRRIFTFCSKATYQPDADPTHCDRLLECLDPPDREIFLRTIAASLDLPKVREHLGRSIRALLCQGNGNNGKDTLRYFVSLLFGGHGMVGLSFADWFSADSGRLFSVSRIEGARISWSSENSGYTNLDGLQLLKQAITGETMPIERKNYDARETDVNAVFLFNINDPPRITGALEAIKSRYAILPFDKTFAASPKTEFGQLQADPRYKYNPEWAIAEVLPAFLNRLLTALEQLMREGIDFSSTEDSMELIKLATKHLYGFAKDTGLVEAPGHTVEVLELWNRLEAWYLNSGILIEERSASGHVTRTWQELTNKGDRLCKARNQVIARVQELWPRTKTDRRGEGGRHRLVGLVFVDQIEQEQPAPAPEFVPAAPAPVPTTATPTATVTVRTY